MTTTTTRGTGKKSLTTKTWAQLEVDLEATMRKWRSIATYTVESVFTATPALKRRAGKDGQTPEERTVTLTFRYAVHEPTRLWRDVKFMINREARALDNFFLLTSALETMRMADVHGVTNLLVKMYKQMYPTPVAPPPPPPPPPNQQQRQQQTPPRSTGPYATLHISDDAPLEVAEAAYRALVKGAHPDVGGSHTFMVALNAAISAIRASHAIPRR